MKIDRLETHDRLLYFKQDQALNISQGAEDCLKKNALSLALQEKSPYVYLFAHPRTIGHDEKVAMWSTGQFKSWSEIPEKVMFWQPRLTKPVAQTNSYCFRALSKSDILEVCWLLPPEDTWAQYKKGNVTENEMVLWSIAQYLNNKSALSAPEKDDLGEEYCKRIYKDIAMEIEQEKRINKLYTTQGHEEDYLTFL